MMDRFFITTQFSLEVRSGEIINIGRWVGVWEDVDTTHQGDVYGYNVTDLITGMCICRDLSKENAIKIAKTRIKITNKFKEGEELVKGLGYTLPVNDLEKFNLKK